MKNTALLTGISVSVIIIIVIIVVVTREINNNDIVVEHDHYTGEDFAQWFSEEYDTSYETILEIVSPTNVEKQTLCDWIDTEEKKSILQYWRQSYYQRYSIDPGIQKC